MKLLALLLASTAFAQTWQPLFDGKTLDGWKQTAFTGGGEPKVADGAIQLVPGGPMTGITERRLRPGACAAP